MNIRQKPSGNYEIRQNVDGKTYYVTVDHKPTKKEAQNLIDEKIEEYKKRNGMSKDLTFQEAGERYNELKANVLSPSTILGYDSCLRRLSESFLSLGVYFIENEHIQAEISRIACSVSEKTTRNMNGYILTVLKFYRPDKTFNISLPPKQKKEEYIPTEEDVKRLLDDARQTRYYIPLRLACYGLRRSELCCLTLDDLDGNVLTINKSTVHGRDNKMVVKPYNKTYGSTRKIVIDGELRDLIIKQGYIYDGYIDGITDYMTAAEKRLGMEHFTIHKLRHFFASTMSGVLSEADLLEMGGWSTDYVMKKIYRHAMETKNLEAQKKVSDKLSKMFA